MVFNIPAGGKPLDYRISRSLRFYPTAGTYLSRMWVAPTDRNKWTFSTWVKRSNPYGAQILLASDNLNSLRFQSDNNLAMQVGGSIVASSAPYHARYRDSSAWMHVVCWFDGVGANGVWIFVNNVGVASAVPPGANTSTINTALPHHVGTVPGVGGLWLAGYLADTIFVDGLVLGPTAFGQYDSNNVWQPKQYTGSYGNNGFHLNYADNSSVAALGKDVSGRGNNWAPVNHIVTGATDSMVDSPTSYGVDTGLGGEVRGNYCTLSSEDFATYALAKDNGNLIGFLSAGATGPMYGAHGTFVIPMGNGKWYWEYTAGPMEAPAGPYHGVGVLSAENGINYPNGTDFAGHYGGGFMYYKHGYKMNNGISTLYGATWTTGDVIGVALDATAPSITFYKNGVSQGVAYNIPGWFNFVPVLDLYRVAALSQHGTFNFGQRPYAYPAPAGHKALCTTNLPDPPIKRGDDAFSAHLRAGSAVAPYSVTGKRFKPELIWLRRRTVDSQTWIYDNVRGPYKEICTPALGHETHETGGITSFNADGYSCGSRHADSNEHVDWMWKRGTLNGLDIVTYTGNGVARNISHNLGVAPAMIIIKERAAAGLYGWYVYHHSFGPNYFFSLNSEAPYTVDATVWNNSTPLSTHFVLGGSIGVNENGAQYVAYVFADVPGFSKFGYYGGVTGADGPLVLTGFRPSFVMVKGTHIGSHWYITDAPRNAAHIKVGNPMVWCLFTSLVVPDNDQSTLADIDFLANGFKARGTNLNLNTSGFIYAAFAEHPFKFSRAK